MLAALQNLLSLATSWKAYIIVSGLVIAAIAGYSEYWHHMGAVSERALCDKESAAITKKDGEVYAKIEKAVSASRAAQYRWMLARASSK